jgi:hypothetical protein
MDSFRTFRGCPLALTTIRHQSDRCVSGGRISVLDRNEHTEIGCQYLGAVLPSIVRHCRNARRPCSQRFRHTFAVELLLAGVPIERVAVLLGHTSVKTTISHYSAWSVARQQQLEDDFGKTWDQESSVTRMSHKSKERANKAKNPAK